MSSFTSEQEAKDFFSAHILDSDCSCEDCCTSNYIDEQENIFALFNIPFVPLDYKDMEWKYGNSYTAFRRLWFILYGIKEYNVKMEKKDTNKSMVYCIQCGKLTFKNKNRVYNKGQLCLECSKKYSACSSCNKLINTNIDRIYSVYFTDDQKNINCCWECYTEMNLEEHKCVSCGNFTKDITKMRIVIRCRDNITDELIYNKYCTTCGMGMKKCYTFGCNELAFSGHQYCCSCSDENAGIQTHNYKPIRRPFHYTIYEKNIDIDSSLFFGFELETEQDKSSIDKATMAHLIKEIIGKDYIYCMRDGSLYNGIEVASFPFSWDWYKKVGKDKWTELLLFLSSKGYKGDKSGNNNTNPVGFHVHTTKAAWSNLQVYKLIQFTYNPSNRDFMNIIAGRPPMTYCRISDEDWDRSVKLAKDKMNVSKNHYNMINLNKKEDTSKGGKTIEFRMFKGSLEPLIFHKNLEFIKAIFEFTKDYTKKEMFTDNFIRFVVKNKKEYPCLLEYLISKTNDTNSYNIKSFLTSK